MASLCTINGIDVERLALNVPYRHGWTCEAELVDAEPLDGQVVIAFGETVLRGSVCRFGDYGQRGFITICGGLGWSKMVSPRAYQSDGGVLTRVVVDDLAVEIGETIGTFQPQRTRLGSHFVRMRAQASCVLTQAIGPDDWWVDYDGLTHVGVRHMSRMVPFDYTVVDANPNGRYAVLALDDVGLLQIGSVVMGGPWPAMVVHELCVDVTAEKTRMRVWGVPHVD